MRQFLIILILSVTSLFAKAQDTEYLLMLNNDGIAVDIFLEDQLVASLSKTYQQVITTLEFKDADGQLIYHAIVEFHPWGSSANVYNQENECIALLEEKEKDSWYSPFQYELFSTSDLQTAVLKGYAAYWGTKIPITDQYEKEISTIYHPRLDNLVLRPFMKDYQDSWKLTIKKDQILPENISMDLLLFLSAYQAEKMGYELIDLIRPST